MPHGNGNFEGERTANCKVFGRSVMSCAKTAEPIEMPFGIGNRVGPTNHVLGYFGFQIGPSKGAIFVG